MTQPQWQRNRLKLGDEALRLLLCALALVALIVVAMAAALPARGAQSSIVWSAPLEIASGAGYRGPWRGNESKFHFVDDPSVALYDDGAAALVWVDQRQKNVLFQIYGRDGKPRLPEPVNVSRTPRIFSWLPRIALSPAAPDDVYVLWQEIVFAGGSHGGEIFFARSRDGGKSFSAPVNLSHTQGGAGKARVTRDFWHNGSLDIAVAADGTLYTAWTEYEGPLLFSRSEDRGERFSKPVQLAGAQGTLPARAPALAIAPDGTVYLAWTLGERADADIQLARSTDRGRTFGATTTVAQTAGYAEAPKLAAGADGVLHVVWSQSAGGPLDRYHIHYARSRDGGRTFEPPREISAPLPQGIRSAAFPSLGLDAKGSIFVVWELFPDPRRHPRGLAMAHSVDGGQTFSAPAVIPDGSDPAGGTNGSQQGLLMRKLAANARGELAVVNSSFRPNDGSRVWMIRAALRAAR